MVTGVASVARQYYQDTWGSVKSFWSRKRWLRKESEDSPMERDYTKIYQKYYADQQALFIDDHSSREKHSRLSSAFLRPWGAKYSKPKESARTESVESSTAEYYSIGIQGFVEDDEVSDTPSQVEVDGGGGDEIETDTEESFEIDISNREEVDIKRAHTSMEDLELQFDDDATADANEGDVGGVKEIENDIEETELQVDGGINIVDAEDLEEGENGVIPVSIESLELQVDDDAIIDEEEVDVEEADEVEIDIEDTNIQGDIEIVIPDLEEERENAGIPASIEGLVLQVGDDVTVDEEVDVEEVDVIETNIEDIGIQFDGDIDIADMEEEENAGIHTSMEDLELKVAEDITLDDDAEEVDREDILQEAETPQVSEGTESDLVFVIESTEEEVDSKDIPIPIETDESTDYIESTSVEGPRPRKFFKRLWGTGKDISQIDSVVGFDNEEDQVEIKGTDTENEPSTDVEEIRPGEGSDRPNFFKRIWGANKELNEIYSLGLQGIKDLDSPTEEGSEVICDEGIVFISESETEETTEDVLEEFDVDISVSIGSSDQVEESLDVDTFDISESSGVEESEDERDISEPKNLNGENLEDLDLEEITSPEEGRYDRNVLQLHIPESAEIKEQIIHTSIEVTSESGSSKDLNTSETMYRLELCREDCDGLTPEDVDNEENIAIVKQENSLADIDVSVDNVIDEASNELESAYDVNDIKDALFEEEESQEEDIEGSMFAEGIEDLTTEEEEDSIEEDQEEDIEGSVVVEVIEDVLSEEEEDPIEEEDQEEDTENSVIAEVFEDLFSEEEDTEEDQEEDIEGSVVAEVIEDVFSETEEYFTEGEEQEDGAYDDISSHYSLELEMESANFLTKFLVNRGLEQLIMIAILIMEWFRMYIIAPFFESIDWIKEGKGQDLLQTVLNARGGALASSVSDSEDVDQMHNSEEDTSEDTEALGRGEPTSLCDDEGRSDGSMEIEKEGAEQVESAESEKLISTSVPTDISVPASPRVPPNFIFRRLLNYGVIGHILIMEMIVVSEWIQVYVPQIPSLAGYIVYDMLKYKRQSSREREEPVNKRNSGFINIGEGSRLGRKPKKLRKKEDQNALDQLKRIGDVNQAKYRFLSQKFMERHALGPYSATISEIELDLEAVETDLASKNNQINEEVEAESDSGWILDALGVEEEEDIAPSKSPFDTNVGVSLCSSDPKVSVGIEFSLGRKKSTKTSSQKLRNVFDNDIMASKNKIKTPKPHVSDIESGVMGRIRAAGANSLVGRSILGAYPGDLPPPDEAASPKGVINLARRYGYGDWSDDDDGDGYGDLFDEDENNDDDDTSLDYYSDEEYQSRPKQRSSTRTIKKKKTRKRRSSSSQQQGSAGVSVEFGFGGSSKSNKTPALSSATRKRRKSPSSLSSSGAESILSSSARRRKSRGSRLPSLPMEKLGETYASSTITTNRTKLANTSTNFKDGLDSITSRTIQRKRKSSTLRPAGVLLDEAKKAAQSSKED
uniref:Uncharacterized protein n=1 Tax=Pseudo-nitzschia australis TaxID=44445 RepID=A0A7S4ADD3_9STRA